MGLGMTYGKFSGKCHNCGKQGHELQSVGVTIRHHAPTEDSHTSRLLQDHRASKNTKKTILIYLKCIKFFLKCFG